jgi:hypothetical protein
MTDSTHEALRAHLTRWLKSNRKRGMEINQLGEHDEALRWLCGRLDALTVVDEHERRKR